MLNKKPNFQAVANLKNEPLEGDSWSKDHGGAEQDIRRSGDTEPQTDMNNPSYRSMLNQKPRFRFAHIPRITPDMENKRNEHPKPQPRRPGDDTAVPPMISYFVSVIVG